MIQLEEIWQDVILPDVDVGRYQVSNLGNIRSNDWQVKNRYGYRTVKGKVMKLHGEPYTQCSLSNKAYYVHRVVAIHFIPNPDNLPEVNHIDGNIRNNCVDNLEWCNKSTNAQHMYQNGMSCKATPVICVEDNIQFRSISEAARYYNLYFEDVKKRLFDSPKSHYSMIGKFNKHFVYCKNYVADTISIKAMVNENKIHDVVFSPIQGVRTCSKIPIVCVETGQIYPSLNAAADVLRVSGSDIRRCIDNPKYTCKGYHFRRLKEVIR